MSVTISLTKRERKRRLQSGAVVMQTRYVLNFRDPRTGDRKQLFFERQKDAQRKANEIQANVTRGTYAPERKPLTVKDTVVAWIADRSGHVKQRTHDGYEHVSRYITEPLLIGTSKQRAEYAATSKLPKETRLEPLLGHLKVSELTTADIRSWHKMITREVGAFTANRAKQYLGASLALAAEDHHIRPPTMPTNLGRGRAKEKKAILSPEQVAKVIQRARQDTEKGVYYAFPFLTGTRPSEQLALLWEDVDFDKNVIRIRRMQEPDGSITNLTKTAAGTREIPMCATLREMLLEWRVRCPRKGYELHRVFPGIGQKQHGPSRALAVEGPCSTRTFAIECGRLPLRLSACPTSPRTRRGTPSSRRCKRKASRSASSPSWRATQTPS
jgi:integrase